jgi:peptidoglycan hydrolase-like protein with peptidoglycan-binding domain
VLILSGLGLAAFAMSSELAMRATDAARQVAAADTARGEAKVVEPLAVPRPRPVLRTTAAPRSEAASPGQAPVVVTLPPRSGDAAPARTAVIPRDRDSLARELQKELRRVGCYEGELNGVWTPATRRAMKIFTDRVNATLPVDEPDAVLFAMVQSQQERVCGKPCPVDQGLSEDGRCLPNAILAKAARSAIATHVPASGGPAAKPLPARSWSATVTAARPTPPAVDAPAAPPPPQALPVIAPAAAAPPPTEGRMALAGPIGGQAAADLRLAVKPTARSGGSRRIRPPQHGPHFVSTPRPRAIVSTQFRRFESRL